MEQMLLGWSSSRDQRPPLYPGQRHPGVHTGAGPTESLEGRGGCSCCGSSCPLWRLKWSRGLWGSLCRHHSTLSFCPRELRGGVGRLPLGLVCDQCLRKKDVTGEGSWWSDGCERLGQTSLEGRPQPLQWPDHHRTGQVSWAPLSSGRPTVILIRLSRAAACPWAGVPGWPSSPLAALCCLLSLGWVRSAWGTRWLVPSPHQPVRPGTAPCRGPQLLTGGILQQCCRGMLGSALGPPLPFLRLSVTPSLVWVVRAAGLTTATALFACWAPGVGHVPDFLSFLLEAAQFLLGYLCTFTSAQTPASCLDATQHPPSPGLQSRSSAPGICPCLAPSWELAH